MKKKSKKIILSFLSCMLCVLFICPFKAFADSAIKKANDIIDRTRYYWGDMTDIDSIVNYLDALSSGTLPVAFYDEYRNIMDSTATNSAMLTNQALIAYANASTSGGSPSVTIQDSWTAVGKRQIVYPYDDMLETDYIYVYVDNNQTIYSPQQFGSYAIAPNSILLVRDTNWNGVEVYSIPIELNRITFYYNQVSYGITFEMLGTTNETFIYESLSGTQTVGYTYTNYTGNNPMRIINNSSNTIRRTNLVTAYNEGKAWYNYFIADHAPLSVLQCFLGTGYNYSMRRFMGDFPSWAFSCGYVNSPTLSGSTFISSSCNTNINNTNDPAKPPVYVVPSNDPWASGKTIDNSTVNNYNDYGVTINNGSFDLDVQALGDALSADITPTFQDLISNTYDNQPDIGVNFHDNQNDINFNDLLHDLLGDIVNNNDGDAIKVVWDYPKYDALGSVGTGTTPDLPDFEVTGFVPDYSAYTSQTLPVGAVSNAKAVGDIGWNLFDSLGLIPIIIPLVLLALLWKLTGGD